MIGDKVTMILITGKQVENWVFRIYVLAGGIMLQLDISFWEQNRKL